MTTRLLTAQEVLERAPISKSSLYALIRQGEIPHVKVAGRILIPESWLDDLIASAYEVSA